MTAASEPELRETVPSHREADALVAAAWQAHHAVLLGAVVRSTRDRDVAEDIVAEAFEALLREARAGRAPANPPAWLHRVARNRVIDWSRRRARWAGHGQAEASFVADPEATVLGREAAMALHLALASLPEAGRRAVVLEGLGYRPAEIAPLLGRTNQATRTLLCRARRRVAVELARRDRLTRMPRTVPTSVTTHHGASGPSPRPRPVPGRFPMRTVRPAAAVLAAALVVSACAAAEAAPSQPAAARVSPAPATRAPVAVATPRATSTSSAPAVDVAAAFTEQLEDLAKATRLEVDGEFAFGAVRAPIEGRMDIRGPDTHTVLTISIPGAPTTSESMVVDGTAYELVAGAWFEKAADGQDDDGLGAMLSSGVRDTGPASRDGRTLHRLVPVDTTAPTTLFGLSPDQVQDLVLEVTAWAEADGTPVAFDVSATWTQLDGEAATPASQVISLTFAGTPGAIEAPSEAWTWATSAVADHRIGLPPAWETMGKVAKYTAGYMGFDGSFALVSWDTSPMTLNQITNGVVNNIATYSGLKPVKVDDQSPTTMGGLEARRIDLHGRINGSDAWQSIVVVKQDRRVYVFAYVATHAFTDEDQSRIDTFLASISFT